MWLHQRMTSVTSDPGTRIEHDLIGFRDIPEDVYWGVHTLRALENFPITGIPIGSSPHLVEALAAVKQAAATANHDLGLLDDERYDAIRRACEEIRGGALVEEFGHPTFLSFPVIAARLLFAALLAGRMRWWAQFPTRCLRRVQVRCAVFASTTRSRSSSRPLPAMTSCNFGREPCSRATARIAVSKPFRGTSRLTLTTCWPRVVPPGCRAATITNQARCGAMHRMSAPPGRVPSPIPAARRKRMSMRISEQP